jgi:hypothetical protein
MTGLQGRAAGDARSACNTWPGYFNHPAGRPWSFRRRESKALASRAQTIARQQSDVQRLTVANEAAQQQLNELEEVKQKLGRLVAAVNKFMASGLSRNEDELASAGQGPARR